MSARAPRTTGVVAALPLAAAAALLLARHLPIQFSYRSNELGIVSLATLQRYPQQKEAFWLVLLVAVALVSVWTVSRWLAARPLNPARLVAVEALATGAPLALLWLPPWLGALLALGLGAGALWLAGRGAAASPGAPVEAPGPAPPRPLGVVGIGALALALALVFTREVWVHLWAVAHGVADEVRTQSSFAFHGEVGQHLAWANALTQGGFHGKDFFCLYGPFYDLGLAGMWQLLGRSIVVWELYFYGIRVLALAGLVLLVSLLVRHRLLAFAVPLLIPWMTLRIGFGLYGLCLLIPWLRGGGLGWVAGAGVVAGVSLLFSQEFGLAFLVVAGVAFALRWEWRPPLVFASALAAVAAPVLAWYAANGALLPMLQDVAGYPSWVVAGYAKIPFPALASLPPVSVSAWRTGELLEYQLGYAMPAISLGAVCLVLPLSRLDLRTPLASAGAVVGSLRSDPWRTAVLLLALYGLLCFRTALGRSDVLHMIDVLPPTLALFLVACDRVLSLWRSGALPFGVSVWRAAALGLLLLHAGFTVVPAPYEQVSGTLRNVQRLLSEGYNPVGSRRVVRVTRYIQLHTEPGEPVLFLPNNGAYYYLTDRPNPIRFVMGHQIVTQAHRDEVLADLRARPPRYVVWDDGAMRVDQISDELVFGKEILAWINAHYQEEERFGPVAILRFRGGDR